MMTQHEPAVAAGPALNYLHEIGRRLAGIREEVPGLIEMGTRMGQCLLAGGQLFCPAVGKYWPSEFGGRAGGLMGVRERSHRGSARDLAYFTLPDPRRWEAEKDPVLGQLMEGEAHLFVNGRKEDLAGVNLARFEGFTGGPAAEEGGYGYEGIRPLAPMRVFDQFVRGWITAGEMIAACTRGGRMPILWMSVWLEGAFTRNACFLPDGNLREPWRAPVFHENTYIPPLAPGYAAAGFLAEAEKIQAALVGQASRLARAGQWMAETRAAGGRIWCVAVGHSYPVALEVPKEVSYPIEWGPSVSDLSQALPEDLRRGDVKIHFGYSPVDVGDVRKILDRGVKFIYSSPYGRPEQLKDHENLLWLDLPWRPADATVDIPGYSVRMLPMSSTAHTMAYFAILSEMAERMGWR